MDSVSLSLHLTIQHPSRQASSMDVFAHERSELSAMLGAWDQVWWVILKI
jgi:hypothetical protein